MVSVNRKSRRIDLHLKHLSVGHTKKGFDRVQETVGQGDGKVV